MNQSNTTPWHARAVDDVLEHLGTRASGLTEPEVAERIERFGANEIARRKPLPWFSLLLRQFANFFVLVLLFAAALAFAVSFMPGEAGRRLTAIFILGIVALSVALSFVEEYRSERALEALEGLLLVKAAVIRSGVRREIHAAELVPGDILVLSYGRKIPADARLIEAHSLRTDESSLTGESMGVDKSLQPVSAATPLAERKNMVFASTFITHGTALAVVVSTGMATEVGKIAATLGRMEARPTPFQVEVRKMARQMTVIVGTLALFVAVFLLLVLREPWVDVALNTLSLAVATIPESLPIVLTFALALGARQMSWRKAVVRRLSVVESLGSVDTICTDKTGTLTENRMSVRSLFVDGRVVPAPNGDLTDGSAREVLRAGVLCNEAAIDDRAGAQIIGDPVDAALLHAAQEAGLDIEKERRDLPKVDEIPFSSERKMMTTFHRRNGRVIAYTKGAPEEVLARCATCWLGGRVLPLDAELRQGALRAIEQLESEAWYLLALARKEAQSGDASSSVEQGMTFLGLQAMMDLPRPEASGAIAQAKRAGIRVLMMTGDNARTARAVGKHLGIGERFAEAGELDNLSSAELQERVRRIDIVARATPQTKLKVLQALQGDGHFVAMTGDGVNDATALKQADVGVAMGLRGTDIAKESANMVLLDDNFASILAAVEEGRRIFDNIRKFTNYLLSTSLGEVFIVLALSAAGYFPLSAKMLLWVNVVTDLVPASALAADPAVPGVMQRRPRRHDEPILNRAIYATIAGSIFRTLIAYGFIFWVGLKWGGVTYARTLLFTSIVLHSFTRVMVVRQLDNLSLWSNRTLLYSYAAAVGFQLLALYTPLRGLLGVEPLDRWAWGFMLLVVAGSSLSGVYMTRWILRHVPLWDESPTPL